MKPSLVAIPRLASAALLATGLLAGTARDAGASYGWVYEDGVATQAPDAESDGGLVGPLQDDSNDPPAIDNSDGSGLYRQGDGTGENHGDGSSSYGNAHTGNGVITDGQGGVWVHPDPGGYTPPSPSE